MKKECIVFGASKLGRVAKFYLEDQYEIKAFIDNDEKKWGQLFEGIKVFSPTSIKKQFSELEIVIASSYAGDIAKQLNKLGVFEFKIFDVNYGNNDLANSLTYWDSNVPSISLGNLLKDENISNQIDDLTFISGGSTPLDYFFLNTLLQKFSVNKYLEIGTFSGESMAIASKYAKECYSITLPDESLLSEDMFKLLVQKNNFSRLFCKTQNNIKFFYEDSLTFDYTKLPKDLDLVFIDADHTYKAIKKDTENIFNHIDWENCIVVWHDIKNSLNQIVYTTMAPILEALPSKLRKNVFVVDRNLCGVYIPNKYLDQFVFQESMNEIYSYEVQIKSKRNIF